MAKRKTHIRPVDGKMKTLKTAEPTAYDEFRAMAPDAGLLHTKPKKWLLDVATALGANPNDRWTKERLVNRILDDN